jgi:hypothetical protein
MARVVEVEYFPVTCTDEVEEELVSSLEVPAKTALYQKNA